MRKMGDFHVFLQGMPHSILAPLRKQAKIFHFGLKFREEEADIESVEVQGAVWGGLVP